MIALKNKGEKKRMKKKALAVVVVAVSMLFVSMFSVVPTVTGDVFIPPGPPNDMSEWIIQGLHVIDLQTMEPIGWKYTDGPTYDPITQRVEPKIEWFCPEWEGPTWIPFSTWVMVIGCIPDVVVSPDQAPPPVVLVITWNGVPYAVTLDITKEHSEVAGFPNVGMEYPPTKYGDPCPHVPEEFRDEFPCFETVYPWVYPAPPLDCPGQDEWKKAYYNVWVGDPDCATGPKPHGYYFWYIFHPNVGDWMSIDCYGWTKHPPTYDITALFEYSTSQIWFNHKCFDVRLLEVHKEIKPHNLPPTSQGEEWTEELVPIEDAWILDIHPDTNFGSDPLLHARSDIDEIRRSYLKFDLSGLDLDCLVRARFKMYCADAAYDPNFPVIDVEITRTSDFWDEGTITWTNAPAYFGTIDMTGVAGPGSYYWWEGDLLDYINDETAAGDYALSLVAKLPMDYLKVNPTNPFFHRDFDSRETVNPPKLVLDFQCPGGLEGAQEISNILSITNVGKVPAHNIDIWESYPIEPKEAIIPKWDTCTAKLYHADGTTEERPLLIREAVAEYGWPYELPDWCSILYPGETLVIAMEASVNVDNDWEGCLVIDAMVSACEIPPWKYPRAFDVLTVGDSGWEYLFLHVDDPFIPYFECLLFDGLIFDWFHAGFGAAHLYIFTCCPCLRNPIPQTCYFEWTLDPDPVDLTGDGVINADDVAQVKLAILELVPFDTGMDTNVNGKVDAYDLARYEEAAAA